LVESVDDDTCKTIVLTGREVAVSFGDVGDDGGRHGRGGCSGGYGGRAAEVVVLVLV